MMLVGNDLDRFPACFRSHLLGVGRGNLTSNDCEVVSSQEALINSRERGFLISYSLNPCWSIRLLNISTLADRYDCSTYQPLLTNNTSIYQPLLIDRIAQHFKALLTNDISLYQPLLTNTIAQYVSTLHILYKLSFAVIFSFSSIFVWKWRKIDFW